MAKTPLAKLQEICLSLPDTKETLTWGKPHFRVGDKIFAGFDIESGRPTAGFKLEMDHADMILGDPRFSRAPYVGHKGWVQMDLSSVRHWDEVRMLIHESYRLIAPKKSQAKLAASALAPPNLRDQPARRAAPRRPPPSPASKARPRSPSPTRQRPKTSRSPKGRRSSSTR